MAALNVQKTTLLGTTNVAYQAVSASDTFENDGKTVLRVKNDGAAPVTATVDSLAPCNQGFDHDATLTVAAGQEGVFGPFPRDRFGSPATVSFDAIASVTALPESRA